MENTNDTTKYDKDLFSLVKTNRKARERLYKNRTVAYVMKQKHPQLKDIPLDTLQKYCKEICKLDRQWRMMLMRNKDLRGLDYDCKKIHEQKAQIELGYEQGYYQDIKKIIK
jgi:hypothetical protein